MVCFRILPLQDGIEIAVSSILLSIVVVEVGIDDDLLVGSSRPSVFNQGDSTTGSVSDFLSRLQSDVDDCKLYYTKKREKE